MPASVSNVNNEWLLEVWIAPHLYYNGTFKKYEALSLLLQVVLIPRGQRSYMFLKRGDFSYFGTRFQCSLQMSSGLNWHERGGEHHID